MRNVEWSTQLAAFVILNSTFLRHSTFRIHHFPAEAGLSLPFGWNRAA